MIKNKSKFGELNINKLIIIILCVLVLLTILMFIYKVPILEWLRNLPDYKYDEDKEIEAPETVDAQTSLACVGSLEVGFLGTPEGTLGFREQYIYIKVAEGTYARTKFYWRGSETDGKIWFLKDDKYLGWDWFDSDLEVAEVKKNIIFVNPKLLSLDSEIYQRTRFSEKPIELKLVNKLNGSYAAGMNRVCRKAEETQFKPAWPESAELNIIPLHLKINPENGLYSADFSPYVNIEGSVFRFLYLVNQKSFIEIRGDTSWAINRKELGRIYPDGSVWFNKDRLTGDKSGIIIREKGAKLNLNENFKIRFNEYYEPYYESNIRIDNYDKIMKIIK